MSAYASETRCLADVRYRNGLGTAIDVADADAQADAAVREMVDAQRSLRESIVAVRFAAGLL